LQINRGTISRLLSANSYTYRFFSSSGENKSKENKIGGKSWRSKRSEKTGRKSSWSATRTTQQLVSRLWWA